MLISKLPSICFISSQCPTDSQVGFDSLPKGFFFIHQMIAQEICCE